MPKLTFERKNKQSFTFRGRGYQPGETCKLHVIGPDVPYSINMPVNSVGEFSIDIGFPQNKQGEFYAVSSGLTSKKSDVTRKFKLG